MFPLVSGAPPFPHLTRPSQLLPMVHSILGGIHDVCEQYARDLLSRVSRDYQLKEQELVDRYVIPDFTAVPLSPVSESLVARATVAAPTPPPATHVVYPSAPSVPKKRGRKKAPGLDSLDLSKPLGLSEVEGLTIPSLKDLCKQKGLKIAGSRTDLIERFMSWQSNPDQEGLKPRQGGRKKSRVKQAETSHNHPLDSEHHPDCPECSAHGNPLAESSPEFEVAPAAPVAPTAPVAPEGDFEVAEPLNLDSLALAIEELEIEPEAPKPVEPKEAPKPEKPKESPKPAEPKESPKPAEIEEEPEEPTKEPSLKDQLAAILGAPDEEDDIAMGEYDDDECSSDGEGMDYGDELVPEDED